MDPTNTVGPEVPLSTPEKKDGHWIAIAAMALFVAASLVAVGFLYYQNQKLKTMLAGYQTQATPTPITTTDTTANWKTYTSKALQISFKYPNEWKDPQEKSSQKEIVFENILTIASKSGTTLDQFVNKNLPTDGTLPVDYNSGDIQGKRIVYKSGVDQAVVDTLIVFPNQDNNLIIISYTNSPGHITKSETIDQILSTFKFLSPTSSPTATQKACTQEAKICPNGSAVGRTGPNCEFAPCPTP